MTVTKKVNYLNNKDILKEIHKSKMSFCYIEDDKYDMYDIIVDNVKKITKKTLSEAKENRANRIQSEGYAEAMLHHDSKDYRNKPKQKDFAIDPESIDEAVRRIQKMKLKKKVV